MRILAGLVVPVCACLYAAGPPVPPPPSPAPSPQPAPGFAQPQPTTTMATPAPQRAAPGTASTACGQDQIFETVCGTVGAPNGTDVCGPRGDSLTAFGDRRVAVTFPSSVANDPLLQDFLLDDPASDAYRRKLAPYPSPASVCCYSRCTQLTVARTAKPRTAPPKHTIGERCIPAPDAGTSVPAKAEPLCPAAAALDGTLAPLKRSEPAHPMRSGDMWWARTAKATCCYATVERVQEEQRDGCDTCRCAAAGTLVATPTGEVAIETLQVGDRVLSMDHGALRAVSLVRVSRTPAPNHVMIVATLDNGRTVSMSPLHPTADHQRFGDLAAGTRLGDARVVSVAREPYTAAFTYDILPESDSATYVANGALVGSTLAER